MELWRKSLCELNALELGWILFLCLWAWEVICFMAPKMHRLLEQKILGHNKDDSSQGISQMEV